MISSKKAPTDSKILFAAAEVAATILSNKDANIYVDDRSGCKELNHIPFWSEGIDFLYRNDGVSMHSVYKLVEKVEPKETLQDLLKDIAGRCRQAFYSKQVELEASVKRIDDIVGFDLSAISSDIKSLDQTLSNVKDTAMKVPELSPLVGRVETIKSHFGVVSKVVSEYDAIFKAIVKPMYDNGKEGIDATKRWAIISVVLSAVVSTIASIAITVYFQAPSSPEASKGATRAAESPQ